MTLRGNAVTSNACLPEADAAQMLVLSRCAQLVEGKSGAGEQRWVITGTLYSCPRKTAITPKVHNWYNKQNTWVKHIPGTNQRDANHT
jgi:hypothetical protein